MRYKTFEVHPDQSMSAAMADPTWATAVNRMLLMIPIDVDHYYYQIPYPRRWGVQCKHGEVLRLLLYPGPAALLLYKKERLARTL